MEGSSAFLYAAIGVTLLAIVGYLLFVNGRLTALRREREALERGDRWDDEEAATRATSEWPEAARRRP